MAITRLSGGNTPPDGSDPRTFPAIWNDAVDDIEALELPITAARIADGAVTAPKLANTAGAVMVFDDATARATAIPTPVEGMVTYLKDEDEVTVFDGSVFKAVGPGKILQVVSTTKTDTFSTASATFETVTGLTATITPSSSSSKILVTAFVNTGIGTDQRGAHIRLSGGNAGDFVGDAASNRVQAMGTTGVMIQGFYNINFGVASISGVLLDSPATTSAVTYGVEMRRGTGGTGFVNRSGVDADNADNARLASSITVMEVAG